MSRRLRRAAAGVSTGSTLLNGLLNFYKLSDTADAVGGIALTNNNSATFTAGKIGNALTLVAASSQYLSRAARTWGIGNAWSVSVWHKTTSVGGDRSVIQFGANMAAPTGSEIKFQSSSDALAGYVLVMNNSGAAMKLYTNIPVATNSWAHTAITWDGTNLRVYRNGSDITGSLNKLVDNAGTMADVSRPLFIGCGQNGSGPQDFIDGQVDAACWASRAWTPSEVAQLYNGGSGREHPFTP